MANKKGMHEKQMESARKLLEHNVGLTEIVQQTGLSQEDVLKEKHKMERRFDD
ncbi:hypothetical protein [Clostridium manihotivorum]|uniref:hypothetical protein n=1 Tax=Clostridium manihotivorum TaxID=2320868 RepID=UPI0013E2ED96|nr:hypothetical protein [Clostridium manihotivorum]